MRDDGARSHAAYGKFGEFVFVAAERSTAECVADDKHSTPTHPDPVRVSVVDLISVLATFARRKEWSLLPFLRAGRKRKPDSGEFVVRRVPVDAITLGICLNGNPGPGTNPLPRGVRAGRLAHTMTARLHVHDPGMWWLSRGSDDNDAMKLLRSY